MATWPAALPQSLLVQGLSRQKQDNAVRFNPEVGKPIVRRRGTGAPRLVQGAIVVTTAQLATLATFFDTTLADGTDTFTWKDPMTGASATVSFGGPYSEQAISPGIFRVSMQLLILP